MCSPRLLARLGQAERSREANRQVHDSMYLAKLAPPEHAKSVVSRPISAPPKTPINQIRGDWALWK